MMKRPAILSTACLFSFVAVPIIFVFMIGGVAYYSDPAMPAVRKYVAGILFFAQAVSYLAMVAGYWKMKRWGPIACCVLSVHWVLVLRGNPYANFFLVFLGSYLLLGAAYFRRMSGWPGWAAEPAITEEPRGEGEVVSGGPAGFWVRGGAAYIDWLAYFLAGSLIPLIWGNPLHYLPAITVFAVIFAAVFNILQLGCCGRTLGKRAAGIRVNDSRGLPVSYARAAVRHFAALLGYLTLGAGFLLAAFTKNKKALHDLVAGTVAVYDGGVGASRKLAVAALNVMWVLTPLFLMLYAGGGDGASFKEKLIKGPGYGAVFYKGITLGPSHPDSIAAYEELADHFWVQKGNCTAALPWYERALLYRKKSAAQDIQGISVTLGKYSSALKHCGKEKRAEEVELEMARAATFKSPCYKQLHGVSAGQAEAENAEACRKGCENLYRNDTGVGANLPLECSYAGKSVYRSPDSPAAPDPEWVKRTAEQFLADGYYQIATAALTPHAGGWTVALKLSGSRGGRYWLNIPIEVYCGSLIKKVAWINFYTLRRPAQLAEGESALTAEISAGEVRGSFAKAMSAAAVDSRTCRGAVLKVGLEPELPWDSPYTGMLYRLNTPKINVPMDQIRGE